MNILTKFALGLIGQLRPKPPQGDTAASIRLPPPQQQGGLPLMEALRKRHSGREFAPDALPLQLLSDLLWAAFGINRPDGRRTAASALNAQEVDIYAALPSGAYLYDASAHALHLVAASDLRRVTGYQDFVDDAPLDLVYVANHPRMLLMPEGQRVFFASASAGGIAQNIYLFCASSGLSTVIRAWLDRAAIAKALGLPTDRQVLLSQTVGYPKGRSQG
jgi:nitroreductase